MSSSKQLYITVLFIMMKQYHYNRCIEKLFAENHMDLLVHFHVHNTTWWDIFFMCSSLWRNEVSEVLKKHRLRKFSLIKLQDFWITKAKRAIYLKHHVIKFESQCDPNSSDSLRNLIGHEILKTEITRKTKKKWIMTTINKLYKKRRIYRKRAPIFYAMK